jgi:hypothetical protein
MLAPYRYDDILWENDRGPGRRSGLLLGAAWDKGLDFRDRAAWEAYVKGQRPDFEPQDDAG